MNKTKKPDRPHTQTILDNQRLLLTLRIVLGGIFITSAILKLPYQSEFTQIVSSYGVLPDSLVEPYSLLLPWTELLVGCLLLLGLFSRLASGISLMLIISFIIANIYAMLGFAGNASAACGCFGESIPMSHEQSLALDLLMVTMTILLMRRQSWLLSFRPFLWRSSDVKLASIILLVLMLNMLFYPVVAQVNGYNAPDGVDTQQAQPVQTAGNTSDDSRPVLLYFYSESCGYCQKQKPIINELETEYGDSIYFIRTDVNNNPRAMAGWNISTIPSIVLGYSPDVEAEYRRFEGLTEKEVLQTAIASLLELSASDSGAIAEQPAYDGGGCTSGADDVISAKAAQQADIQPQIDDALESGRPVFLFFYAEWCSYCQKQKPIIDKLEDEYGIDISFMRVESLEQPEAFMDFGIIGFPTMLLIASKEHDSYVYQEFGGFTEKDTLSASFEYLLENGSLPEDAIQTGYVHHSCSTGKCYENCIVEKFEYPSLSDLERKLTDFALDCLGAEAGEAFEQAYDAAKAGECIHTCANADTPRQWGDCVQCGIGNTIGKIPAAGCVVGLWGELGDLLEPHADCLAECAAPSSTWEKNWGHPCRDYQGYQSRCVGSNVMESLECRDCEWVVYDVHICDEGCEMTADGAVCKGKCKEEWCDDGDECTIDWCYKQECHHERKVGPGCDCPDSCDDGNRCTTDYCDENNSCQHTQIPGCCPTSCDDYDRCTRDWCDGNGSCRHSRKPGCDKPDDNYDYSDPPEYDVVSADDTSSIAILNNGFADVTLHNLNRIGRSAALIDPSLQGINNFSILVVPSGGLAGLDNSEIFRERLWSYVENGGTLIAFTQQRGYEFQTLPGGGVGGYGWFEDQACHSWSVGLTHYHPIFAGQDEIRSTVNVDGFFTTYPRDASILLTRIKNGMPAMILYDYGEGRVLASTAYSDMSVVIQQRINDEEILLRDIFSWADARNDIETYGQGTVELSIPVYNPQTGTSDNTVPEFNVGEIVDVNVEVENSGNLTADNVTFMLFDPSFNPHSVNVTAAINAGETQPITLTYQTAADAESGIWKILYFLYSGDEFIVAGYAGDFTLGYDLASASQFQGYVTVTDPTGNTVVNTDIPLDIQPGTTGNLEVDFTAEELGVWNARYSVLNSDNTVLMSSSHAFAVSHWDSMPEGWGYQGKDIEFSITSDADAYYQGATGNFTIHVWNYTDIERDVTCWYSFPHNYWRTQDDIYGAPGTTRPGHRSSLFQTLTVPAQGYSSFDYSIPIYSYDRLWAQFYDGDETSEYGLGKATRGFHQIRPEVSVSVQTDRWEYAAGENITVDLELENETQSDMEIDTIVQLLDASGTPVSAGANITDTLTPNVPVEHSLVLLTPGDPVYGNYRVRARSYLSDFPAGGRTALININRQYTASLSLDRWSGVYAARDTLMAELTVTNTSTVPWSGDIEVNAPGAGYTSTDNITLADGESDTFIHSIDIPADIEPGTYAVAAYFPADNYTIEERFTIRPSRLAIELQDTVYNVGENIVLNLSNTGGVDTSAECTLRMHQIGVSMSYSPLIMTGQTMELLLPTPISVSTGFYMVSVSCENSQTGLITLLRDYVDIIGSELELSIGKTSYNAGENVTVSLTNTGPISANASCSISLTDDTGFVVNEINDIYSVSVNATETLLLPVLGQAPTGSYQLSADCTNENNGKVSLLDTRILISGLEAVLTSVPDKTSYLEDEDINLQTDISNGSQPISGGVLNLSIWQSWVPSGVSQSWANYYDGLAGDNDEVRDIDVDASGNIYVTGSSANGSHTDYTTIKYSSGGVELWTAHYDNGRDDEAEAIAIDAAGSVYVTGRSEALKSGSLIDVQYDCVTVKYDAEGVQQWAERYDGTANSHDGGHEIVINGNGNVIVTGYSSNVSSFRDYLIIKYDASDGTELWASHYNGPDNSNDEATALAVDDNGNVFVTGGSYDTSYNLDFATVKYASDNGTELWATRYDEGSGSFGGAKAIAVDGEGNVYVTGSSPPPGDYEEDYVTVKYDGSDGTELWAEHYDGPVSSRDLAQDIIVGNSGDVYITGYVTVGGDVEIPDRDFGTVKYSSYNGTELWVAHYGGGREDMATALALDSEGNIYVTGTTVDMMWNADFATVKYDAQNGDELWQITFDGIGDNQDYATAIAVDSEYNVYVTGISNDSSWKSDYATVKYSQEAVGLDIWERDNIPVNLDAGDSEHISTTLNILTDLMGVTGKLFHAARLYNIEGQLITESETQTFYIFDTALSLTLETDKDFYRPEETVIITGQIHNAAALSDNVALVISQDGSTIYTQDYVIGPGETIPFSTTATAVDTFVLQASANGAALGETVEVKPYNVTFDIIAPDIVGLEPFDVALAMENKSETNYVIDVSFAGSTWEGLELNAGATELLDTSMSIVADTTLEATLSGDVIMSSQKLVVMGETATLQVTPDDSYMPGEVEIPFSINNTGVLDIFTDINFTLNGQNASKTVYVPSGELLNDALSFIRSPGTYTLEYSSYYGSGALPIIVAGGPEFIVTDLPDNLDLIAGDPIWDFTVKNIGMTGGFLKFYLRLPDWQDQQYAWLETGEETLLSFEFIVPDDLEEKSYKAYYEINDVEHILEFNVQGPKITVVPSLDKNLYEAGDTAILTLDITNTSEFDLDLFARVLHGEYEAIEEFPLSANSTVKTLQFDIPVDFDSGKLFYGIYMASGRALHLNALYVHERQPLALWTDRQVYDAGDNVTVYMVPPYAGTVNITAPGYTDLIDLSAGTNTTQFTLPQLVTGTYYIEHTFDGTESSYPFDIRGYLGRISEFSLNKGSYRVGESLKVTMTAEVNQESDGKLDCSILDHWGDSVGEFEASIFLAEGENNFEIGSVFNGDTGGIYSVECWLYVESNGQLLMLASAGQYFDAVGINEVPIPDAGMPYFATEGAAVLFDAGGSYDLNNDAVECRWDFDTDGIWDTDWSIDATASNTWQDDWTGTTTFQVSDGESLAIDTVMIDIANMPPVVTASANQQVGTGQAVHFSGSFVDYGVLDTHTVKWDFGDGASATGTLETTHTYNSGGTYNAVLTVTDDDDGTGTKALTIKVTGAGGGGVTDDGDGGDVVEPALPASFTLSNFKIISDEVRLGETFIISIVVANSGDLGGRFLLKLEIDDVVVQTKEVTLAGGASETVNFSVLVNTPGTHIAKIGDLELIFDVLAPESILQPPPDFVISSLSVEPHEVRPSEEVSISALVTNTGGSEGSYSVVIKVNNMVEAKKEITLRAGESERMTFTLNKAEPGTYTIDVNGELEEFRVVLLPPPAEPSVTEPAQEAAIAWWPISVIIAGCLAVGLLAYFLVHRKRRASRLG